MYLSKQWRESRIITSLAILGLVLLLALVVKAGTVAQMNMTEGSVGMFFVPLLYVEAGLAGFWGWLAAAVGVGKNLGEDSGSFLFTRPRLRAWFVWSDWGYAMVQIAAIIALANLMIGLLLAHILHLTQRAAIVLLNGGNFIPLYVMMLIVSIGVLLFAGLIYGLTYFSTVVLRRASGVLLGAGILVGYLVLGSLVHHYYPAVHFPNLIVGLFHFDHHGFYGLSGNLAANLIARSAVMVAFPIAAQLILDRSEI